MASQAITLIMSTEDVAAWYGNMPGTSLPYWSTLRDSNTKLAPISGSDGIAIEISKIFSRARLQNPPATLVTAQATQQASDAAVMALTYPAIVVGAGFSLTGAAAVTIAHNTSGTFTVTTTFLGSYTGVITFSANTPGATAGITFSFSPGSISTTGATTVLTISVANTVPVGDLTFRVIGTDSGTPGVTGSTPFILHVT